MRTIIPTVVALALGSLLSAQTQPWLDGPLSNWNAPGQALPVAKPDDESVAETSKRCSFATLRTTAGERAVAQAGWIPFRMFDRQVVQGDVEIIGGLAGADGMCRPVSFNVFVFVGERFAGTLSPELMDSRTDGSLSGAIRLAEDGTIDAGFARYTDKDPLCCPSGHVTVRYRIDRQGKAPIVVPVNVRKTRP